MCVCVCEWALCVGVCLTRGEDGLEGVVCFYLNEDEDGLYIYIWIDMGGPVRDVHGCMHECLRISMLGRVGGQQRGHWCPRRGQRWKGGFSVGLCGVSTYGHTKAIL
jgi:hypothetical protein